MLKKICSQYIFLCIFYGDFFFFLQLIENIFSRFCGHNKTTKSKMGLRDKITDAEPQQKNNKKVEKKSLNLTENGKSLVNRKKEKEIMTSEH